LDLTIVFKAVPGIARLPPVPGSPMNGPAISGVTEPLQRFPGWAGHAMLPHIAR